MYWRLLTQSLLNALADTRVVLLNGARQVGKSTLARRLASERRGQYLTLDDPAIAALAHSDPGALVHAAQPFTVIDEAQLAPGLFAALKREVDHDPRPGRFLLTGSANVFLLPRIAESLAGRMEVLTLHPLAQAEIAGSRHSLVDALFDPVPWVIRTLPTSRAELVRRLLASGFPEALGRTDVQRREAWFSAYLASLLQRDVRAYANIEGLNDLPRLLALLAARSAALLNMAELSRATGIAHSTLRRYLALLEATFILQPLPAWSANLGKRLVKAPKIHLLDAGLAAHLQGELDSAALAASVRIGPLLETFVVQELRRQLGWSRTRASAWHLRTAAGREVDLVLEAAGRRVVGIEVKASASVGPGDFAGLRELQAAAGPGFVRGVVFYSGDQLLPFGEQLWAMPLAVLWAGGAV